MKTLNLTQTTQTRSRVALVTGARQNILKTAFEAAANTQQIMPVLYIDGENSISRSMMRRLNISGQVELSLKEMFVTTPYTAKELHTLVLEDLHSFLIESSAKVIFLSQVKSLFYDPKLSDKESRDLYSEMLSTLMRIAKRHNVTVFIVDSEDNWNSRSEFIEATNKIMSDRILTKPEVIKCT